MSVSGTLSQARQLAGAVAVGAVAGGLVIIDARVILVVGAAVGAMLALRGSFVLRGRGVAGVAWACAAFTAAFNGVRLSSFMALSDGFLLAAVAAMLLALVVRERSSPAGFDKGVLAGLAMIAAGGLVGTLFAVRPETSLVEMAKFVISAGGSVLAFRLWSPGAPLVRWFCSLWLTGAVVSALWALTFSTTIVGRPSGLSTHPNHLGIVCLLATAVALGLALGGRPAARRLSMVALPPLVLALVASGSRAALLGFFVMVPAVAVLAYRVQLALRAAAAAAVVAVAVLAGIVHIPADTGLGRLFGDRSTPGSDQSRLEHFGRSIDRFERHPLTGEGFEFAQEAHNIYLQVLVAAGPLGLIGFAVVAGSVLRAGSSGARSSRQLVTGDHALLAGLVGGYVGYLVAGLFQNILWDRYLWLYVAAILSLAASLRAAPSGQVSPPAGTDSRSRPPDRPPDASRVDGRGASRPIPGTGSSR